MDFENILYTVEEGIATITLNRPQSMNSFHPGMLEEWLRAIERAKADLEVKVIVVTGAGRAFSSGGNIRSIAAEQAGEPSMAQKLAEIGEGGHNIARSLLTLDKPYLGAINGPATGGGMDMASLCDIRIASERARFGMTYVRMGVIPGLAGCYILPRLVGIAHACELIWTGRLMDAQEALRMGYVSQVVPHEELMPTVRGLALKLARGPSVAIQLNKRLIYQGLLMDEESALEAHRLAMLISQNTEDAKEGPRAWMEKREPIFKGR